MARQRRKGGLGKCRICGSGKMRPIDGWACMACQQLGSGKNALEGRYITRDDAEEILKAMHAREELKIPILEGFGDLEINSVARLYSGTEYSSYGRLRGYCDNTGRVPPMVRNGEWA